MGAISLPSTTFSIIPAQLLARVKEQKVLIVGQQLGTATATAGDLIQDFPDDGSEDTLFGRRSHIAGMIRAFKRENKITQLDVIPLDDDGGATQGTCVITFTGTATAAGTLTFAVGSAKDHEYELDVAIGDTHTDLATDLAAFL